LIPNKDKAREIDAFFEKKIKEYLNALVQKKTSEIIQFLKCIDQRDDYSSCISGRRLAINAICKKFGEFSTHLIEIVRNHKTFFFQLLLSSRYDQEM
jgi:hypothetical protein